ncbi:flavodoxin family protein, partial [Xanthomonas citri pv. citri]|nr:flavodoxin family protein [Xanthomonas citri pv. citri]
MKIYVVYDSEGEHTKVLAEAIAEGARENDAAEVFIDHVDQADIRKLKDMDAII